MVVLVYCLSVIFIKLWGHILSDTVALLWKRAALSAVERESAAGRVNPSRSLETGVCLRPSH